ATSAPLPKPRSTLVWRIEKNTGPIKKARTSPETTPLTTSSIRMSLQIGRPVVELGVLHYSWKFVLTTNLALAFKPPIEGAYRQNVDDYFTQRCTALHRIVVIERLEMGVELCTQNFGINPIVGANKPVMRKK